MGFLRDASESILKYSGILVNKTEEYTRIAKLNLEVKKVESDIDKREMEIGEIVVDHFDSGQSTIDLNNQKLKELIEQIRTMRSDIERKKDEIEALKKQAEGNTAQSSSQAPETEETPPADDGESQA